MAANESAYKRAGLIRGMRRHQEQWDQTFGAPQPQIRDMAFGSWDTTSWAHKQPETEP